MALTTRALVPLTTRALVPLSQQTPPSPPRPSARQWQPARRSRVTSAALLGNSFHTLQSHRLRSLLTILGITIGIAAVIAVVCLTQGVNEAVDLYFTRLGTNSITIIPTAVSPTNGVRPPAGSGQTLTLADSQAIAGQVAHIVAMSPVLNTSAQVIYSDQNWQSPIQGVYPNFQGIAQWQLDGRQTRQ
jgi:putative ABC transport system permease protein